LKPLRILSDIGNHHPGCRQVQCHHPQPPRRQFRLQALQSSAVRRKRRHRQRQIAPVLQSRG
jgi:hypothetical protein